MSIEEAIEILAKSAEGKTNATWKDYEDAIKLGIEALKRVLELRQFNVAVAGRELPGETK